MFVVLGSKRSLSSAVQRRVLFNHFITGRFRQKQGKDKREGKGVAERGHLSWGNAPISNSPLNRICQSTSVPYVPVRILSLVIHASDLTINRGYSYSKVVPKDAEAVREENRSRRSKTPPVQNERTAAITKDSNGRASKARRSKRTKCHPRELHTLSLLAIKRSHRGARDIIGDNSHH